MITVSTSFSFREIAEPRIGERQAVVRHRLSRAGALGLCGEGVISLVSSHEESVVLSDLLGTAIPAAQGKLDKSMAPGDRRIVCFFSKPLPKGVKVLPADVTVSYYLIGV